MRLSQFKHSPISEGTVEADLITAAQAGDEAAMMSLIGAYVPGLCRMADNFTEVLDPEDAEQEVLAAFLGHVHAIDPERTPTAALYWGVLRGRLGDLRSSQNGIAGIHRRTQAVYSRAMRAADYDAFAARDMVCTAKRNTRGGTAISEGTFWAVHNALAPQFALLPTDDWAVEDAELLAEEHETIRDCIDRLPSDQRAIVRYAYGFVTSRPLTDAEVVEELSRDRLPPEEFEAGCRLHSRRTVARKRAEALDLLRADFLSAFNGIEPVEGDE